MVLIDGTILPCWADEYQVLGESAADAEDALGVCLEGKGYRVLNVSYRMDVSGWHEPQEGLGVGGATDY